MFVFVFNRNRMLPIIRAQIFKVFTSLLLLHGSKSFLTAQGIYNDYKSVSHLVKHSKRALDPKSIWLDILTDCCLCICMNEHNYRTIYIHFELAFHTEPYPFCKGIPSLSFPTAFVTINLRTCGPRSPNITTTNAAIKGKTAATPNGSAKEPVKSLAIPNGNGPIADPKTVRLLAKDCTAPRCFRP